MKKLSLLLLITMVSVGIMAQTIVDTIPQNRKAILEEYTGIHCTFCPDGHRIANEIANKYPGEFFAINVHQGGYASPQPGEPDFRTNFGDALAGQTGLQGYPSGTINRHKFSGEQSMAVSRNKWETYATNIMSQSSYVNVAASASINVSTREMIVYVEGYFTQDGAPTSMKLNLAVNQNNVAGPQTGDFRNPDQILASGDYNHSHMLRHLITGQWGVLIDTTAKGSFFKRTFTWQIPTSIRDVTVELGNLEVIAFVTESRTEIITGNKAEMEFLTPPGVSLIDLEVKDMTTISGLCDNEIVPTVKITNNTADVVADTFAVEYSHNGGKKVTEIITTPLAGGSSTTVTFPAISIDSRVNKIVFTVDVKDTYHLVDITTGNNEKETPIIYHIPTETIGSIYYEDFEGYNYGTENTTNMIAQNQAGVLSHTAVKEGINGVNYDQGALGNSEGSYNVFVNQIPTGEQMDLTFHKMNFSNNTQYGMTFFYAYSQVSSSSNDKLRVIVSDDCGETWTKVWEKSGSDLATAPIYNRYRFFPKANEWGSATIDLSAYNGKPEVLIAFRIIGGGGNGIALDDINIYNNTNVGIENTIADNSIMLYPNPASSQFNLSMELAQSSNVSYSIVNNLGQTVMNVNLGDLAIGANTESVDISGLASGIYIVHINVNGQITSQKLSIQ